MTVAELAGREAELRPDHEPKVNVNGIEELVTDKGYHSGAVLQRVKSYEVCSYIPEKQQKGRRNWQGKPAEQQAVYENRRRVRSEYGKSLLRRRGELVERSFAHCYETGGLRRCHLRGRDNILKRQLVHVGAFNLSLILRQLLGAGTPRELRNRSGELVLHALLLRWYGNGPQRGRSRGISVSTGQIRRKIAYPAALSAAQKISSFHHGLLGVCFPAWRHNLGDGWWSLLAVPRLYFVILLCVFSYVILIRRQPFRASRPHDRWAWVAVLVAALLLAQASTFHHQCGLYSNDSSRLGTSSDILLATNPVVQGGAVLFTALIPDGYRSGIRSGNDTHIHTSAYDRFSQSAAAGRAWIEESGQTSRIASRGMDDEKVRPEVEDAEFPVASSDGRFLAYLRSTKGRSRLWLRTLQNGGPGDIPITPPDLDVREMSFLSDDSLAFAAARNDSAPQLFSADLCGDVRPLGDAEARYPSVSPDGRWLAYGRQERGLWNLWVMDLHTSQTRRITNQECNDTAPTWEADSKTIVFASDCGRGLWFTALYRRQVIP